MQDLINVSETRSKINFWPIILGTSALLFLWQFYGQFRENEASSSVLFSCVYQQENGIVPSTDWWKGALAYCLGNEAKAINYWQSELQSSNTRLPLIQAQIPHNVALAETAVERFPNSSNAYFWLGDSYRALNQETNAAEAYRQGLEIEPQNGLMWRNLGDYYRNRGDTVNALYAYDQACYWVDQGKNGCLLAAQIYAQEADYASAEARYRDALLQLPNFPRAKFGLAEALFAQGKNEEADIYLQMLLNEGYGPAIELEKRLSQP